MQTETFPESDLQRIDAADAIPFQRLPSSAHDHYQAMNCSEALTYRACGIAGTGLFVAEAVAAGSYISEYFVDCLILAPANARRRECRNLVENEEYMLSVEGGVSSLTQQRSVVWHSFQTSYACPTHDS